MEKDKSVNHWSINLQDYANYGGYTNLVFIYKLLNGLVKSRERIIELYNLGLQYDDMSMLASAIENLKWFKSSQSMRLSVDEGEIDKQDYVEFSTHLGAIIASPNDWSSNEPWNYSKYGNTTQFDSINDCLEDNNVYIKGWIGGDWRKIEELYGNNGYNPDVGHTWGIRFPKQNGVRYCLVATKYSGQIDGRECSKTNTGDSLYLLNMGFAIFDSLKVGWIDKDGNINFSSDLRRNKEYSIPVYEPDKSVTDPYTVTSVDGDRCILFKNGTTDFGGSNNYNSYSNNIYEIVEFDAYANCYVFHSEDDAKLYLQTGDSSKAINQPIGEKKDYIDLNNSKNYNSYKNPPRVTFEFINPKPLIVTDVPDQIRFDWHTSGASKNQDIQKTIIYDIPAGVKFMFKFDGATAEPIMNMEQDANKVLRTIGIYDGERLIWSHAKYLDNLQHDRDMNNIFWMPTDNMTPQGDNTIYHVSIKTNRIFLRYWPYAFSRDELPTVDDPMYEIYDKTKETEFVRPDGLPDADGKIIRCYDHMLDFNTIKEMKDASDVEYP